MFRNIRTLVAAFLQGLFAALPSGLRYLYYLRFSLMIWLFPLAIAGLNNTGARTLTSGILVPELGQQYLCVGFFLLSTGLTALVIARINVINGEERFSLLSASELDAKGMDAPKGSLPPSSLKALLNNDRSRFEWIAVLAALVPAIWTGWYIVSNAAQEGVEYRDSLPGLLVGAVLALIVWAAVNILYYLLYKIPGKVKAGDPVVLGTNAARTILFPRRLFSLPLAGRAVDMSTIEAATASIETGWLGSWVQKLLNTFVRRVGLPGYVYYDKNNHRETDRILEAQFFAMLASGGFALTYVVVGPLSAPVPTLAAPFAIAALLLATAVVLVGLLSVKKKSNNKRPRQVWFAAAAITVYALFFPVLYYFSDAERFPVFASILVAATMLAWLFGGFAYFLDRFRVPVLTFMLLMIVVPRLWPGDKGREEHFFSVATVDKKATADDAPTPARILQKWLGKSLDPDKPVIIVTATGGGLHASAWTAAVLDQLETQFKIDPQFKEQNQPFYANILLLSTVSGGSTGALSYLDEHLAVSHRPANASVSAACSSLEAVGWGVIYHDLPATLLPNPFWLGGASSGVDDLPNGPMLDKDRTWALRVGFERNLRDTYCARVWYQNKVHVQWSTERDDIDHAREAEKLITLRSLAFDPGKTPAVVMNTTTAEHGSRFLLSNYAIPRYALAVDEALPAESFLQAFGNRNISSNGTPKYADLPIATAAQLSATFPYVSSAARFPAGSGIQSAHFIDGGYYDNDGTASVLEFLRYAMDKPETAQSHPEDDVANQTALEKIGATFGKGKHLRVILVEIRNSADDPADDPHGDDPNSVKIGPKNLLFQLYAPLLGFWNAGHESVTARNRAALHLIEEAYADRLTIHHIVIADTIHKIDALNTDIVRSTDPLSWSLTPRQRKEIRNSSNPDDCENRNSKEEKQQCVSVKQRYREVITWTGDSNQWNPIPPASPKLTVVRQ